MSVPTPMPAADRFNDTTTVWNDGQVLRTDWRGRTTVRPSIVVPANACPVCWTTYCLAIPRKLADECWRCGDKPRAQEVQSSPQSARSSNTEDTEQGGFDLADEPVRQAQGASTELDAEAVEL